MKNLVYLSILFTFIIWLGGCEQKTVIEASGKTIKIGLIAPLSGPDQTQGKEGLRGMEFAMLLQPLLTNGDRVELITEDDKNDPALSVQLLKKMVEEDKVSVIITFSSSDSVLAMAKIANENKTPILAAVATHPDITKDNDFISQLCFDDNFQGTTAALFVRDELLVDKVAIFYNPTSTYSSHLASEFERKFQSIGGEITDTIRLAEETTDLYKIIKRVYDNSAELLYLPIRAEKVLHIIREVRNLRWTPQMMGSDGLLSEMIKQHQKELDLVEGMLAIDLFAHGMPLTSFGKKARDKFRHAYKGKQRVASTTFSALAVEGYVLLLDAMNSCHDPADRECISGQIRSTDNFEGIAGNISIGPDGKAERPLYINSIQSGLSKYIVKVY
jgi:branched-chain amino acid transport system substrate-binding protein